MGSVPVFFTEQCPWDADTSTVVLFYLCKIISNDHEHDSDDQINNHRDVYIDAKSNGIAGTYDYRGKNCHEPD